MTEKSFKVTLPGSLYEKNSRWWWKVKLPGETRVKARGLKPKGARFATADRDEAEKVAREMWESAIRAEVQAQVQARAGEKARASSEEMAKVKAEAAETVARMKSEVVAMIARAKAECEERLRLCNEAVAGAQARVRGESEKRAQAEERLMVESDKRAAAEEKAMAESQKRAEAEAKLEEALSSAKKTAACDCCGKAEIPENELSRIDSGQLLCSDCLRALRG
jgi:hypothetical protein